MRALHRVLVDQALREKLKHRGYEQATKFSWDDSARQLLKVYEDVAGNPRASSERDDVDVIPRAVNS